MSHKYRKIDQKDQTKAQTLPFKVAIESQSVGMVPALGQSDVAIISRLSAASGSFCV